MITLENTKTLYDLVQNAAKEYEDKIYLRYEEDEVIYEKSYRQFADDCNTFSSWIDQRNNDKGDKVHVALLGRSSYTYLVTLMGTASAGAVSIPLDVQLNKENLVDCIERSDTDIVFYDLEFNSQIEVIREKCSNVKEFICLQNRKHSECIYNILDEYFGKEPVNRAFPEQCAVIIFTSGTTGRGKGVMLSHSNLIDNTFCTTEKERQDNEVYLNVLPMHHIFCLNGDVFLVLRYGGTLCLSGSLSKMFYYINIFKPTAIRLVPMMAKAIYNKILMISQQNKEISLIQAKKEVLGEGLHKLISGGGYLSEEIAVNYLKLGVNIAQGYGMSECSPKISSPNYERRDKISSVGKIVDRCVVRIVDGEIQVKSPSVMMGYYKEPDKTAEVLTEDGYLKTGDLGYVDNDNYIYLTGRKKNLIVLSNGENVSPEAIENEFDANEIISEILVYGCDDVIVAEIYPNYEYSKVKEINDVEGEIQRIVKDYNSNVPSYKKIAKCTVRRVPFEKTSSKKIIRQKYFDNKRAESEIACSVKKPENEIQKIIYDSIAHILGHKRFGIDDDIYDFGLNSMGSVLLIEEFHDKFDRTVTLNDLMEKPTVLGLESIFSQKGAQKKTTFEKRDVYPLARMQKYYVYAVKGHTTGNLPFAFKLDNSIDLVRLKKAIEDTLDAHPALKGIVKEDGGICKLFRDDSRKIDIPIINLTEEEWKIREKELVVPFQYNADDNLFHIYIFKTECSKYLLFDVAHGAGDGITMNILLEDVNKFYCNEPVQKEEYSYYEYILEEKQREELGITRKDINYINDLMKDLKLSRSILNKKEKEDYTSGENAFFRARFDNIIRNKIVYFCKENGISENTFFITAFNYCINLFSDEKDVFCTSIHGGRTDNRWDRLAGPLYRTYYFRSTQIPHERVNELLHKSSKQILNTMRCFLSTPREGEMFFQFQGGILNINRIGDAKAERMRFHLDALPFHFQVMYDDEGYHYELRYWGNRFDREQIKVFLMCYEDILNAMMEERSVRRLKKHIRESVYPKHYYTSVFEINKEAGNEMISGFNNDEKVKVYILDENYNKKPYGAWGPLYIMDHKPNYYNDEIQNPYGRGILYRTDRIARILPDKSIDFLENGGRTVMTEGINGRVYYDLKNIEDTVCRYNGISKSEVYMFYDPEIHDMSIRCNIKGDREVNIEDIKKFIEKECGKESVPKEIVYLER